MEYIYIHIYINTYDDVFHLWHRYWIHFDKKLLETVVKKGKKILPKINSLKKINKFS